MRLLLGLCALALLGGCNVVHTSEPMFSDSEAAGAPPLRPGVWAAPDADCAFDPASELQTWPSCANGLSTVAAAHDGARFLVVAGQPPILQVRNEDAEHKAQYFYAALRPTKLDDQGRVIAAETWIVGCGPPPTDPPSPKFHKKSGAVVVRRQGTDHPLPGMVMDPDGNNCTPQSAAALRAAVLPSAAWSKPTSPRWIRDGEK